MKTHQRAELHALDFMRSFDAQEALGRKTPLRGILTI
jgi:hypothetical protein